MRSLSDRAPLPLLALLLLGSAAFLTTACTDDPVGPRKSTQPPTVGGDHALGLVEVTISGIGSDAMRSSASAVGAASGRATSSLRFDITPVPGADGSIQLAPLSTGSFTEGERGNGGERYLYATFKVRNATADGTAYATPRTNLTFLAVSTPSTIEGTAIAQLNKFDGSAADPAIALHVLPTGAVHQLSGQRASTEPDVLQVLTEAEAASFTAPPSVTSVFPYGFVVRNPSTSNSRTLPANPGADGFDGVVTFAFRIPLQASPSDDPFTVSALFLAVDDGETRLTQSLEEQDPAGEAALASRAQALGASEVTLLPGGSYTGAIASRQVCSVRTAGSVANPAATLVDAGLHSLAPDPYAAAGSFIASPTQFTATFGRPVGNPTAETFVVNGSESGRHFLGESYSGGGTTTITSPSGTFFPGEEVEVVLTSALQGCGAPTVARLRVKAPTVSSATFTTVSNFTGGTAPFSNVGTGPGDVGVGDLDGDGQLDLVVANSYADSITVFRGAGDGSFRLVGSFAAGVSAWQLAIGDVNGDGKLDVVTDSKNSISVLLGRGDATFQTHVDYSAGEEPYDVALGDVNGDGALDVVTANFYGNSISVLLGNGDGTFRQSEDFPANQVPSSVALGDLNGDGALDVAVGTAAGSPPSVVTLLGNGDGTFQAPVAHETQAGPLTLAIADVNADGIPDLITANTTGANISVLLGKGDGTFQAHRDYATGVYPHCIVIGDLNGDGRLDVATGNYYETTVSVLLGNGDGTFRSKTDFPVGDLTQSIATGDLNHDGKLDLATVQIFSNTATLLMNQ